jgi:hypothetical protein
LSLSSQPYARADDGEDGRFRDFAGAIESIVTSTAQNDSGLFELNRRDERRMPFDGAGAISTWRIELPTDIAPFDVESISDVVLHVLYTAREAGNLRADAVRHINDDILQDPDTLARLLSLNHDFPDAWRPFVNAADDAHRTLTLQVTTDHFPLLGALGGPGRRPDGHVRRHRRGQAQALRGPGDGGS